MLVKVEVQMISSSTRQNDFEFPTPMVAQKVWQTYKYKRLFH